MPVSLGLQHKFDTGANRKTVKNSLKIMKENIHPEFEASFKIFKKELLGVLKKHSAANDNIAIAELDVLTQSIQDSNGRYNIKLGASIIDDLAA